MFVFLLMWNTSLIAVSCFCYFGLNLGEFQKHDDDDDDVDDLLWIAQRLGKDQSI